MIAVLLAGGLPGIRWSDNHVAIRLSTGTSEPHIHFHHQRQDPNKGTIGLAEGLLLCFRNHDGPPMPEGDFMKVEGQEIQLGSVVRHTGEH